MTNCFVCQKRIMGCGYYCCTSKELTCVNCSSKMCNKCKCFKTKRKIYDCSLKTKYQAASYCEHCCRKMDKPVKLPDGKVVDTFCLKEALISYEQNRETLLYKSIEKLFPKCMNCTFCVDGQYRQVGKQIEGNVICKPCLAQTYIEEKQLKQKQQRVQAIQSKLTSYPKEAEKILNKKGEINHVKGAIGQNQVIVCTECNAALKDEAEFEIKSKGKVYKRYCFDCFQKNPHIMKSLQPVSPVKLGSFLSSPLQPEQKKQSSIILNNSLIRKPNKPVSQLIQKEGSDKKQHKQDEIKHIQSQANPSSIIFPKMQVPVEQSKEMQPKEEQPKEGLPKEEKPKVIYILPENMKLNQKMGSIAQRDEPIASPSSKDILKRVEFPVKKVNNDEFNLRQSSSQLQLIEYVELVNQLLVINIKKEECICCLECNFRLLDEDAIFAQMKGDKKDYKVISLDEIHSKPGLKGQCIVFCQPCYYKQFYVQVPKRYERDVSRSVAKKPKQNAIQDMRRTGVSSSKRKDQSLKKPPQKCQVCKMEPTMIDKTICRWCHLDQASSDLPRASKRNCLTCKKELKLLETTYCNACKAEKIMRGLEESNAKRCVRCSEKVTSPKKVICQICQSKEKYEAKPLSRRACYICQQRLFLFEEKYCSACFAKRPNLVAKEPQRYHPIIHRYCGSCKKLCQMVSKHSDIFCAVCNSRSQF